MSRLYNQMSRKMSLPERTALASSSHIRPAEVIGWNDKNCYLLDK